MTKPQIWVAAFLVLFFVLFMLGQLTKKEKPVQEFNLPMNNSNTETSSEELSGSDLFAEFGCVNCHGRDLTGTAMAPSLIGVSQYWNKESLISYLRNPSDFMNDVRFKEYKRKYPSQMMPGYGEKNIKDLGKIADYLLDF